MLEVCLSFGAGKHGDCANTAIQTSSLLHTNGCAGDLEVAVAKGDVVQTFDDSIDDLVVSILTESDTL